VRAPGPFRTVTHRRLNWRGLAQDLPLKLVALSVALLLWVTVAQAAVREDTVDFAGRIAVERPEIPDGFVLRGQLGDVAVRLRGTPAALSRVSSEDIRATIEPSIIAAARGEQQDAPVRVTVAREGVQVVVADPATVPVRLERIISRRLAVQPRFANEPPSGFVPGEAAVGPAEVTVTGPESAVALVTGVFATVRFGDVGLDLTQTVQALAVDKAGAPVEGVQAEPAAIQVRVPLLPTSTTRTVPVLFELRGAVASGYWVSRVTTDPVAVTIRGEPGVLGRLERLETVAVDVTGLAASRSVRVPLVLPAGVAPLEPTEATVTVTVVALTGTRPFPLVAVQAVGLAATQAASIEPRTIDVLVSGQVPTLATLTAEQVSASVDVTGRAAGTYELDVAVRVPQGATIQGVQPTRVRVTITNR